LTASRLALAVQFAARDAGVPTKAFIERCVRHALTGVDGEVVVRIVGEAESAGLNERFRGKTGATNVLAFPAGETPAAPDDAQPKPLGDIVICGPIVVREASERDRQLEAHWAHILVHGCLHLVGYDHEVESDAQSMERREHQLLQALGFADPYRDER
jgi:probable rRNA maturation factor